MTLTALIARLTELEGKAPGKLWECISPNADEGDIRVQVYHPEKRQVVHDSDAVAWRVSENVGSFIAEMRNVLPLLLEALAIQREALEKVDAHWFDPKIENFACCGCDMEPPGTGKVHEARCHVQIAHDTIARVDALAGKEG